VKARRPSLVEKMQVTSDAELVHAAEQLMAGDSNEPICQEHFCQRAALKDLSNLDLKRLSAKVKAYFPEDSRAIEPLRKRLGKKDWI
jgi:hypothetical protein